VGPRAHIEAVAKRKLAVSQKVVPNRPVPKEGKEMIVIIIK
jgi:hypothetical protein